MEKILVTQKENGHFRQLGGILKGQGFFVLRSGSLETGLQRLAESPALWLLEATFLADRDISFREELSAACRRAEVFCLLFSGGNPPLGEMKALLPWAAVALLHPGREEEVLLRLADQLTIRRLTYERNLAQSLMLEKQKEYQLNLESAAAIQQSLLPTSFPRVAGMRFASRFIPCEKIGGDLFNVQMLSEDTLMVYLLDVSGHGLPAAMVTVSVFQSLSLHAGKIVKQRCAVPPYFRVPTPGEVLNLLGREFPFDRFEKFFTIAYLLVNPATGLLRYSSAGHPPPLLLHKEGDYELLCEGGGIIGMDQDGRAVFDEGEVRLRAGDRIYLYSDGITEYMDARGEFFGEERLYGRLVGQRKRPLATSCEKLLEALFAFGRSQVPRDDVSLLAVEYLGA